MSLVRLLKAPVKLFKKDVITFVSIRRFDLGILNDRLRYIAVRPCASISILRQKVWHLLELPDFCDEIIILKSDDESVIPLTDLRKGNDPHHPYILEVWPPRNRYPQSSSIHNNMLRIENGADLAQYSNCDDTQTISDTIYEEKSEYIENKRRVNYSATTISNDSVQFKDRKLGNMLSDFKKNDLSYKFSSCSLFRKKSHDNFANIFLKIQNDLSTLNVKLSNLETRLSPSTCV